MTTIRSAVPADVPTILRFVRELAVFEREPDAVEATEASLHAALFGAPPAAEAVIAADGEPIGFALFFHNFSTWTGKRGLYLEDLYVTPTARGQGVGAALLRHLAGVALARGCERFEWAVLDWNVDAIAFYRAMGAIGQDEWTVQRVTGAALARLAGARLMAVDDGLIAWVEEAMAPRGQVTHRAMMGGATLYCDGLIFAITGSTGGLWFKADAATDAAWDIAGCLRFTMIGSDGETRSMNYRRAPDDCYDDADALRRWAELALEAGARAATTRRPRSSRRAAG